MQIVVSEILDRIKSELQITSNAELSRFMGVKPQTISSWYARNTADFQLIFTKCVGLDFNFILFGKSIEQSNTNTEDRLLSIIESQQRTIENLTSK